MLDDTRPCTPLMRDLMGRMGERWTLAVLGQFGPGARRFGDIQRSLPQISQRMLALTLRRLERDGLVTRTVFASIPPRVDYQLTRLGETLLEPAEMLFNWARTHEQALVANRSQHSA